jgi:hypothetical protein
MAKVFEKPNVDGLSLWKIAQELALGCYAPVPEAPQKARIAL